MPAEEGAALRARRLLAAGHAVGAEYLVRRSQADAYAAASRIVGDAARARELAQDFLLRCLRAAACGSHL